MKALLSLLLAALATASCAGPEVSSSADAEDIAFELGAIEFPVDDLVLIEAVRSSVGAITPGAVLTVSGEYTLRSRDRAALYFGTTETETGDGPTPTDARQQVEVGLGSGRFELTQVVPGPGYPHVTFYDVSTGKPFGGLYFGNGETLLHVKAWSYAR